MASDLALDLVSIGRQRGAKGAENLDTRVIGLGEGKGTCTDGEEIEGDRGKELFDKEENPKVVLLQRMEKKEEIENIK